MSVGVVEVAALVLVGVALVAVLIVVQAKRERARRDALAGWAREQGWGYSEEDPRWKDYFAGRPFGVGHARRARNVITGRQAGRDFVAFDYKYSTTERSTDSNGHTSSREVDHPYGIVAMQSGVAFPPLQVAPEGFFSRLAGRISGRDIELESEDFNRAFTVVSTDRKFASDVLHPRLMEFLLTRTEWEFRFEGPWVMSVKPGRFDQSEIGPRLDYVARVIDEIPDFIWQQVQGR